MSGRWKHLGCLALLIPAIATAQEASARRARTAAEDLQLFSQVLNQIRVNHPDSVDTHEMLMAAIRAMVRAADPHSYVIPAFRLEPGREAALAAGKIVPVPLAFTYVDGAPMVVSIAPGSAAARLDILPGDILVAVDGRPVRAEHALELELALAGARNSSVELTLERLRLDGSRTTLVRTVLRERPGEASAVPAAFLLGDSVGYVRVNTFDNDRVDSDVHEALVRLQRQGMRGLILDLRDNPGGLVREASRIAGEFLPSGAIVYTASGRKAELTDTVRVRRSYWQREQRYPVVVLVNEGTASAAELVAGALQDHDRALVVGRPSFGKSLIMRGFPLTDGSVAMLVVGTVRTPCGRAVQRPYRGLSVAEYRRGSRARRDTTDLPSCQTVGGRTVHGGGGIMPDVWLDEDPGAPSWLVAAREAGAVTAWAGAFAATLSISDLEAFASAGPLRPDVLTGFRQAALARGITVPATVDSEAILQRELRSAIAWARWGDAGAHRVDVVTDSWVQAARINLGRAAALPGVTR